MKFNHIEGVTAKAEFSSCKKYRYRLVVNDDDSKGNKTVCVIMQNPSVANSEVADKSVQFLEKLIFLKEYPEFMGVSRIIIVNQFAYIQTNGFNGSKHHIGPENDRNIQEAINESEIVLVAWGVSNDYSERKTVINKLILSSAGKSLLQTKAHPSRGTYLDFIQPYST